VGRLSLPLSLSSIIFLFSYPAYAMESHSRRVPLEKRKRTETSCDKCRLRKQKCDRLLGQGQCRYCEINGIPCSTTQPRKQRVFGNDEGLRSRLGVLESLVKGLVPEADLSSIDEMQQLGKSLGIPLPVDDTSVDLDRSARNSVKQEDEYNLPLLPDQQGQVQFIGPASSFSFHHKLRRLIGNYSTYEFAMFGNNAADQYDASDISSASHMADSGERRGRIASITGRSDCSSPSDAVSEIDGPVLDSLIDTYFDIIHSDFPVLHEASFREAYELWSGSGSTTDPAWLCGLLCVLILSRRVASIAIPEEAERKWWRHVQTLLPTVCFSTNIFTVQALMLAALHLHNTTHRDACWNLTGTAIRVAFAIGLHRDDIKHMQGPLGRELRKQLWWTLYGFEQMQVSSYDRPSAIGDAVSFTSYPNERIVGVAGQCPQDLMKWSQRLVVLLGSACKALNNPGTGTTANEDAYSKPLSPAAAILRDLSRWKETLPLHLRLEAAESLAPSSQRTLILLHAQFHYIVVLISRSALLRRATILSKDGKEVLPRILLTVSETCIDSGRALGRLMRKLETISKFNACTWWDIFYSVTSALVLVLDSFCLVKKHGVKSTTDSQTLLRELVALAARQLQNPRIPGSMRKWASIIMELSSIADQFTSKPQSQCGNDGIVKQFAGQETPVISNGEQVPFCKSASNVPSVALQTSSYEAIASGEFDLPRENVPQFWAQLSLLDDSNDQMQNWRWDDIGEILESNSSTAQQAGPEFRRRVL